ncbi:preprotein translocase subunit YajC [Effusibacillus lacus]|uniref:Preprotein translocase subunit YajC n=1 Tax=Effusibacillus lacus TaxID=1348429 RepID=A0A292YK31_9BACL|nr:preprotein translocase subunit YajC [Effusibacillus lacus]TCS68966.1 preprotein translocase subunit YajC [Effusibacillus lacus]GAX91467.1 preprotein translocase subunit YajC [Effusibacillus lacus]
MQTLTQLLPFILMIAIFYFLLIRPQQKRAKERNAMLSALKKGDQVVTIGGMHGTITEIDEDTITLKVAENTRVKFERSAIGNVKKEAQTAAATE